MKNSEDFRQLWKNAGILFGITLIAGILLGFVHKLTLKPIARQQELKVQRACSAVFADAASFTKMENETPDEQVRDSIEGTEIGEIYQALSEDRQLLGYVLGVTTEEGYGGDIAIMLGVRLDGTINGVSILEISETPGLGMRAGEVLVPQFAGRKAAAFTYVKTGASAEDQIDAISGATITTNAFTQAVNAGLAYFDGQLKEAE